MLAKCESSSPELLTSSFQVSPYFFSMKLISSVGKAPGKAGRKIALRSNFYRTKVAPNMRIIQLDVHIQEDNCVLGKESVKKSDEKRLFMAAFLREKFPAHHAMLPYDGQSSLFYLEKQGILANESGDAGQTIRFQYAPRGTRKRDFTVTLRRGKIVQAFPYNDWF